MRHGGLTPSDLGTAVEWLAFNDFVHQVGSGRPKERTVSSLFQVMTWRRWRESWSWEREGNVQLPERVSSHSARAAVETGGSSFETLELMLHEVREIGRPEAKE